VGRDTPAAAAIADIVNFSGPRSAMTRRVAARIASTLVAVIRADLRAGLGAWPGQ
jgi:hypothetical protein